MRRRSYKKTFKGKDSSQDGIVSALTQAGCSVEDMSRFGGVPDLLVGYRGRNYLIECKPLEGDKRQLRLNPNQVDWHAAWKGQVQIAHTPEQALAIIGVTDPDHDSHDETTYNELP